MGDVHQRWAVTSKSVDKVQTFAYDAVSVWVQDLVPKSDESESGQTVSEEVKCA